MLNRPLNAELKLKLIPRKTKIMNAGTLTCVSHHKAALAIPRKLVAATKTSLWTLN